MALFIARKRHTEFASQLDTDFAEKVETVMRQARITPIEHNICDALVQGIGDRGGAINQINVQIKMCGMARDANGLPIILPQRDVHQTLWHNCSRVISGQELS